MINHFKNISSYIKSYYPLIAIFNDPTICYQLGDKVKTYDKIKNLDFNIFKIPKYTSIKSSEDVTQINYYPGIIKISNGSHSKDDTICKNKKQLTKIFNTKFKNRRNVFFVEYIDSYIKELESKHCIRLMVTGDSVLDYYFRPSNDWNARGMNQNLNKILISDTFFEKKYQLYRDLLHQDLQKLKNIYGYGNFAIDCILFDDKLYICEIGLKIFDNIYFDHTKSLHKHLKKISLDENKLRIHYKQYFDQFN